MQQTTDPTFSVTMPGGRHLNEENESNMTTPSPVTQSGLVSPEYLHRNRDESNAPPGIPLQGLSMGECRTAGAIANRGARRRLSQIDARTQPAQAFLDDTDPNQWTETGSLGIESSAERLHWQDRECSNFTARDVAWGNSLHHGNEENESSTSQTNDGNDQTSGVENAGSTSEEQVSPTQLFPIDHNPSTRTGIVDPDSRRSPPLGSFPSSQPLQPGNRALRNPTNLTRCLIASQVDSAGIVEKYDEGGHHSTVLGPSIPPGEGTDNVGRSDQQDVKSSSAQPINQSEEPQAPQGSLLTSALHNQHVEQQQSTHASFSFSTLVTEEVRLLASEHYYYRRYSRSQDVEGVITECHISDNMFDPGNSHNSHETQILTQIGTINGLEDEKLQKFRREKQASASSTAPAHGSPSQQNTQGTSGAFRTGQSSSTSNPPTLPSNLTPGGFLHNNTATEDFLNRDRVMGRFNLDILLWERNNISGLDNNLGWVSVGTGTVFQEVLIQLSLPVAQGTITLVQVTKPSASAVNIQSEVETQGSSCGSIPARLGTNFQYSQASQTATKEGECPTLVSVARGTERNQATQSSSTQATSPGSEEDSDDENPMDSELLALRGGAGSPSELSSQANSYGLTDDTRAKIAAGEELRALREQKGQEWPWLPHLTLPSVIWGERLKAYTATNESDVDKNRIISVLAKEDLDELSREDLGRMLRVLAYAHITDVDELAICCESYRQQIVGQEVDLRERSDWLNGALNLGADDPLQESSVGSVSTIVQDTVRLLQALLENTEHIPFDQKRKKLAVLRLTVKNARTTILKFPHLVERKLVKHADRILGHVRCMLVAMDGEKFILERKMAVSIEWKGEINTQNKALESDFDNLRGLINDLAQEIARPSGISRYSSLDIGKASGSPSDVLDLGVDGHSHHDEDNSDSLSLESTQNSFGAVGAIVENTTKLQGDVPARAMEPFEAESRKYAPVNSLMEMRTILRALKNTVTNVVKPEREGNNINPWEKIGEISDQIDLIETLYNMSTADRRESLNFSRLQVLIDELAVVFEVRADDNAPDGEVDSGGAARESAQNEPTSRTATEVLDDALGRLRQLLLLAYDEEDLEYLENNEKQEKQGGDSEPQSQQRGGGEFAEGDRASHDQVTEQTASEISTTSNLLVHTDKADLENLNKGNQDTESENDEKKFTNRTIIWHSLETVSAAVPARELNQNLDNLMKYIEGNFSHKYVTPSVKLDDLLADDVLNRISQTSTRILLRRAFRVGTNLEKFCGGLTAEFERCKPGHEPHLRGGGEEEEVLSGEAIPLDSVVDNAEKDKIAKTLGEGALRLAAGLTQDLGNEGVEDSNGTASDLTDTDAVNIDPEPASRALTEALQDWAAISSAKKVEVERAFPNNVLKSFGGENCRTLVRMAMYDRQIDGDPEVLREDLGRLGPQSDSLKLKKKRGGSGKTSLRGGAGSEKELDGAHAALTRESVDTETEADDGSAGSQGVTTLPRGTSRGCGTGALVSGSRDGNIPQAQDNQDSANIISNDSDDEYGVSGSMLQAMQDLDSPSPNSSYYSSTSLPATSSSFDARNPTLAHVTNLELKKIFNEWSAVTNQSRQIVESNFNPNQDYDMTFDKLIEYWYAMCYALMTRKNQMSKLQKEIKGLREKENAHCEEKRALGERIHGLITQVQTAETKAERYKSACDNFVQSWQDI